MQLYNQSFIEPLKTFNLYVVLYAVFRSADPNPRVRKNKFIIVKHTIRKK